MSGKKKRKSEKGTRDALAPACFKDTFFYSLSDSICVTCPFFYPCGANAYKEEFLDTIRIGRKQVEMEMVQKRVPFGVAVSTIMLLFGVSNNAASLSYSRRKRKL